MSRLLALDYPAPLAPDSDMLYEDMVNIRQVVEDEYDRQQDEWEQVREAVNELRLELIKHARLVLVEV